MNKKKLIGVLLVLSMFSSSSCYRLEGETPSKLISVSHWDKELFSEINPATNKSNLLELRSMYFGNDDLEIRIWRGFGLDPLEGIIVRRIKSEWGAVYIHFDKNADSQTDVVTLSSPKSGWKNFLQKIIDEGLMALPKSAEEECDISAVDGIGYVVEINQKGTYRNYFYKHGNRNCRESEEMTEIANVIAREFAQIECNTPKWFSCVHQGK